MLQTPPMTEPHPLKLTIEDFELLDRGGVFDSYNKVELIEGMLVAMNAEYRRHTAAKNELMFRLRLALIALGSSYTAMVEPTLALSPYNLPQPDVAIVDAPMARDYFRVEHVALVIEVSDSTLASDLGAKLALYARHGVPEYWVVDLDAATVHQFWAGALNRFSERRAFPLAGALLSVTLPGLAIDGTGLV